MDQDAELVDELTDRLDEVGRLRIPAFVDVHELDQADADRVGDLLELSRPRERSSGEPVHQRVVADAGSPGELHVDVISAFSRATWIASLSASPLPLALRSRVQGY
jgi:hypothetical protein